MKYQVPQMTAEEFLGFYGELHHGDLRAAKRHFLRDVKKRRLDPAVSELIGARQRAARKGNKS